MKLQLTAMERFGMLSVLPEKGNYLNLGLIRVLREALSFKEEEQLKYKIKIVNDRAVIGEDKKTAPIEVPDTIMAMVKEKLKDLERTSSLTLETDSLYAKLILEK